MAIRLVRKQNDPLLRKISKNVKEITPKIQELIEDMKDTLEEHNGLGLAAPQIGVLKRIILVKDNEDNTLVLINPEVLEISGEQEEMEGCLSVVGLSGTVKRPFVMKVKALDENGNEIEVIGEERMATVLDHEIDHLNGTLFIDKATEIYER